ncbi:alpha/beta hydrolase family protein [Stackebrandtia soli]|uniref:alpha/beta hydrolase family protein n=1 Tax=Stackebrandtia soli TaxID=1892856 RepID=UPI0039E7CCF0
MTQTRVHEWSDDTRRHWTEEAARPVRVYVTEPRTRLPGAPTILVSHGTGGSATTMRWATEPFVDAGFAVIGVDHHGNNYIDGYAPQAFAAWWDRPLDLSFALERSADVATGPVGAFGFSLGGYTVAALLGARVHPDRFTALVGGDIPIPPVPEYPDLRDAIIDATTVEERATWAGLASADLRDARVGSAFLVCPSIGPMVDEDSLASIDRPMAVRWGGADTITPADENGRRYARYLSDVDGSSAGDDVEHYWFLADDPDGVDVRRAVATEAVAFFTRTLVPQGS